MTDNTDLDENTIVIFSIILATIILAMSIIVACLAIFPAQQTTDLNRVRKTAIYTAGILFSLMIILGGNFFYYLIVGSFSLGIFIIILAIGLISGIYQIFHLYGLHFVQITSRHFQDYLKNYNKKLK